MPRLGYTTSTRVWLHLEDYYNAGLTPEEAKGVIEGLRPSEFSGYFYCEPSGVNGNWNIDVPSRYSAAYVVLLITEALDRRLEEKKGGQAVAAGPPAAPQQREGNA